MLRALVVLVVRLWLTLRLLLHWLHGVVVCRRGLAAARCHCTARGDGKVAIVTGANCGIGKAAAQGLASRGFRVIMACRDMEKGEAARVEVVAAAGVDDGAVVVQHLDLASLRSVRRFADCVLRDEPRLHVLVNNAAALALPRTARTEDGHAVAAQVNHLGPFLLTCLLTGLLKKTGNARIITVSSFIYAWSSFDVDNMDCEKTFNIVDLHCSTKLWNVVTMRHLGEKLRDTGVTANSVDPGAVVTDIFRNVHSGPVRWFLNSLQKKTPELGVQTLLHLAVSAEGGRVTGGHFEDLRAVPVYGPAASRRLADVVWRRSEQYVGLADAERPF